MAASRLFCLVLFQNEMFYLAKTNRKEECFLKQCRFFFVFFFVFFVFVFVGFLAITAENSCVHHIIIKVYRKIRPPWSPVTELFGLYFLSRLGKIMLCYVVVLRPR